MSGTKGHTGRKPSPVDVHLLNGTFRPDRHTAALVRANEPASPVTPRDTRRASSGLGSAGRRLDRLGRNLRHLILLLDELQAVGVDFVSLAEGIDATTPAGRLQLHVLGAIAEFERARIAERVKAGQARARAQGRKLGRPVAQVPVERVLSVDHLPVNAAAKVLNVSRSTVKRWRRRVQQVLSTPA